MTLLQRAGLTAPHAMYCSTVIVASMGQRVLVLGGQPFLSATERTEEKRAHTCECCAEGGGWVCIVFSRWETQGWERVCVPVCVCVLGACWSVFFLCLSTSELPPCSRFLGCQPRWQNTPLCCLHIHSLLIYLLIYYPLICRSICYRFHFICFGCFFLLGDSFFLSYLQCCLY